MKAKIIVARILIIAAVFACAFLLGLVPWLLKSWVKDLLDRGYFLSVSVAFLVFWLTVMFVQRRKRRAQTAEKLSDPTQ